MSRASILMAALACLAMIASACSPAPAATVVLPEVERVEVLISASYPGHEIDQTTALDAVHQALADASYLPADLPHQPQISAYHSPERKDGQFPRLGALIQPTQKAKPTR